MLDTIFSMKGRTALVAGSGGLGTGMAVGFAKAGADVILADVNPANTAKAAKEVKKYDRKAWELTFDIFDQDSIMRMVDDAVNKTGRIDILANAVGISRMGHAEELSMEDWNAVITAFLSNVFYLCQSVANKAMIPQHYGKIINVASMSGMVVTGDSGSSYGAAKAGLIQLTKSLGIEWVKFGINANAISPGYMRTPLTENFLVGDILTKVLAGIPKKRLGTPADMEGIAVFLGSDASDYLTGQNLLIDGGYTAW